MTKRDDVAISDELMIRMLSAAYGTARDRGLDINDPHDAGVLVAGALRFIAAMARAHGGQPSRYAEHLVQLDKKQGEKIHRPEDPGVRRWTEQFLSTWGTAAGVVVNTRGDQPLH